MHGHANIKSYVKLQLNSQVFRSATLRRWPSGSYCETRNTFLCLSRLSFIAKRVPFVYSKYPHVSAVIRKPSSG